LRSPLTSTLFPYTTLFRSPSWISTIFGLCILIGQVLSALCFAVVVERILFRYKPMSDLLKPEQVHDHGKFMLAFIMMWAYFSFSDRKSTRLNSSHRTISYA